MDIQKSFFHFVRSVVLVALCAGVYAQQPPGTQPDGTQGAFQQRLNTVVRKAEGSTPTPAPNEAYDPLAFYRKNPELNRGWRRKLRAIITCRA